MRLINHGAGGRPEAHRYVSTRLVMRPRKGCAREEIACSQLGFFVLSGALGCLPSWPCWQRQARSVRSRLPRPLRGPRPPSLRRTRQRRPTTPSALPCRLAAVNVRRLGRARAATPGTARFNPRLAWLPCLAVWTPVPRDLIRHCQSRRLRAKTPCSGRHSRQHRPQAMGSH